METENIIEKDISFKSSMDTYSINGTLVEVDKSDTIVLVIGGSGKTDRDETAESSITFSGKKEKLFKQLADAFANKGISSFRYVSMANY